MKCNQCGAPATPGATICEYCGGVLEFGPNAPPAGGIDKGPAPAIAPGGATAPKQPGGQMPGGGTARALAPDGCWYPVSASDTPGGKVLVRFNDGRQATVGAEEVRRPVSTSKLNAGVRVYGEYEGRYYPGTLVEASGGAWNVRFDDGETATMEADQLALQEGREKPLNPGTQCLAQSTEDGAWYAGRVMSGADQNGYQQVRGAQGGTQKCTPAQLNGPAPQDLLQTGKRVMGIGPDGMWYPGTVKQSNQGQVFVTFDDNEEAWVMVHEVRWIC